MQNHFFVLCSKFAGKEEPVMNKISFDKQNFKDIPADFQNASFHPLVTKQSTYRAFLTAISKSEKVIDKECYRNIRLEMLKNNERSEEAKMYLNSKNEFQFKGVALEAEKDELVNLSSETYTGVQLMKLFGRCA